MERQRKHHLYVAKDSKKPLDASRLKTYVRKGKS